MSRSKISVSRKGTLGSTYIGRPSPLGNPFILTDESERDLVCDAYEQWFEQKLTEKDPAVMSELERLLALEAKQGYLILGCHCAPKRCHGDTIKSTLDILKTMRELAY